MRFTLAIVALAAAVEASPVALAQAVTAIITPTGSAPPGCTPTYAGSFGIAVMNVSTSAVGKRQATQLSDGQPQIQTMAPVSMIIDGQIQGGFHTMMMMPVSQIGDGQVQAPPMAPVTEIIDGQPQAPKITPAPAVTQISDAQPQAPKTTAVASAVSQLSEGQPQAPQTTSTPTSAASAVSQVTSAPPQAPTTTSTIAPASSVASAAPSSSVAASSPGMVACKTNGTLALTLAGSVLKDAKGRTGYIASNFQFQFDDPPQAGALITAGFSVCSNGSLALGGSNVFYQCLSGNFYNLYDRSWAAQCSPVTINTLKLITCA